MKKFIILCLLIMQIACDKNGSVRKMTVAFNGKERSCLLNVPDKTLHSHPPLLIVLHGRNESASFIRYRSAGDWVFYNNGLLTVYPNGRGFIRHVWDDWGNEIAFLSVLIDTIAAVYNVDTSRIYIAGFSQGGELAYRMALKNSDRITAIAIIASSIDSQRVKNSSPMNRCVPLISFNSLTDHACPIDSVTYNGTWYNSVNAGLSAWAEKTKCVKVKGTDFSIDGVNSELWKNPDGSEILHWIYNGGGHAWPGGNGFLCIPHFEPFKKLNANQKIVDFFKKYAIR